MRNAVASRELVVTERSQMTSNKQRKAQAKWEAIGWMKTTWPDVFMEPPKPLAVGSHQAVHVSALEAGIPPVTVKAALASWCNRLSYLRAVASGGHRVALDGTPSEPITPEQAEHARKKICRQREIERRKRAARQQAGSGGRVGTENANPVPVTPPKESGRPKLTLRKSE